MDKKIQRRESHSREMRECESREEDEGNLERWRRMLI